MTRPFAALSLAHSILHTDLRMHPLCCGAMQAEEQAYAWELSKKDLEGIKGLQLGGLLIESLREGNEVRRLLLWLRIRCCA